MGTQARGRKWARAVPARTRTWPAMVQRCNCSEKWDTAGPFVIDPAAVRCWLGRVIPVCVRGRALVLSCVAWARSCAWAGVGVSCASLPNGPGELHFKAGGELAHVRLRPVPNRWHISGFWVPSAGGICLARGVCIMCHTEERVGEWGGHKRASGVTKWAGKALREGGRRKEIFGDNANCPSSVFVAPEWPKKLTLASCPPPPRPPN